MASLPTVQLTRLTASVRHRISGKRLAAIITVAAGAALVIGANQGTAGYDARNLTTFLVVGLSLGGIYAISAGGLVATYATTGIFNFAHGAIGCFLAFCYWELRVNRGLSTPLALALVLLVIAPVIGVVLDIVLMSRLRNASLVVRLMVTVGLMLAFMGVTATVWKPTTGRTLPAFFASDGGIHIGDVTATWHRVITVSVAAAVAIALRLLLYRSRLGISMRAVVDDKQLAGLAGVRPRRVGRMSWVLGCVTAGIAGILIAPESGLLVENLTLVVIVASAAGALAQLKSLSRAFGGGLFIGLLSAYAAVFMQFGQDWAQAREAIPAVVLLVAVLFLPHARLETGRAAARQHAERLATPAQAVGGSAAIVTLVVAWANGWIPWFWGTTFGERTEIWLGRGAVFLILGLIMLSLVPLTGWAGQVSFGNFAIAGVGALLYSHLGGQDGSPLGVVWVMLICAPLGAAVALPALRLQGLYLALATMAFAEITDLLIVRHPRMLDPMKTSVLYAPLRLFGFQMSSDAADRKAFVIFLAIAFGLLFVGLSLLRRSRWVRRWIAMSDSPAASATLGVNLTAAKVSVFALSGAIAGFAGCMLGLSSGALRADSFPLFAGLPLVLMLAVWGVRYPVAAFGAPIAMASLPASFELLGHPGFLTSIELIGPGLLAMQLVAQPEGSVYYIKRDLKRLRNAVRRGRRPAATPRLAASTPGGGDGGSTID